MMPSRSRAVRALALLALAAVSFGSAAGLAALDKREYKIYIVSDDNAKDKFVDLRKGFTDSLDKQLAAGGAKAAYTVFDTKANKANVPAIIQAIKDGAPDLIAVINNSGVFADTNITSKLTDPKYRFVSENCIPLQSGIAKTWDKPGGNVTGVGVFLQLSSVLKLAKLLLPGVNQVYSYTWSAPKAPIAYLLQELKSASKATGFNLADFRSIDSMEDEMAAIAAYDSLGPGTLVLPLLSAWVHRDGTPANPLAELKPWFRQTIRNAVLMSYDEAAIAEGFAPAGACVIWYDLGAQMGDKAMKVLGGANPGDLAWSYPRKYNVMFNLAVAKQVGLEIPEPLLMGAYRVYTDFEGNFAGQKN
jgi:putative ABC transport system substrate-binding protein